MDGARPAELVVLIAIMLSAALLRLAHLTDRGYIYWDEGKFALEGARMHDALRDLFGAGVSLGAEKAVGTAKPTHALLIGLADLVLGVHDYSALLLSAVSSTVAVGVTYLIARRLFGGWIAALSALFLAISTYDVIYARSALSESDANLFFLAGVLVSIRERSARKRFAGGMLLGLAITTNYRIVVYCAVAVAVDLLDGWLRAGGADLVRRGAAWLVGLTLLPLSWQLMDITARARGLVLCRNELTGRPVWYLQQVVYQLHEGKQAAVQFDPGLYLQWYVAREGWPVMVLAAIGLVSAALSLHSSAVVRWPDALVAALVLLPFGIYSFAPFVVPRNLSTTLPFVAILAALGLYRSVQQFNTIVRGRSLAIVLALAICAFGAEQAWQLVRTRSGFVGAAGYLRSHAGGRAMVTNEIMVFYLRGSGPSCGAPRIPNHLPDLTAAAARAYPYAALDQYNRPASRFVRDHMHLVARYPQQRIAIGGENLVTAENGGREDPNDPNDAVSVFRLDPRQLPPGSPSSIPRCDRNEV